MYRSFLFSSLILVSHFATAALTPAFPTSVVQPKRVAAAYSKVYAPDGYDSNDHVQLTGEGMFRNTCYRHAETTVDVNESAHTISLGPVAYEYAGLCLQVILPFQRVIDIGLLTPGRWEIEQNADEKMGSFVVKPVVSGIFANSCMHYDKEITTLQTNVIVLQPIAKIDTRTTCVDGKFPFLKTIKLSHPKTGRYLLHVRSLGGNALNSLIDIS